jgi:4-amino-4-deoxy-L-arabinose transferase-like glycosyltransferase
LNTPDTRRFWALLAVLALLAFAFQGTRGIWEPDEGRYTSAGINMLRSGDWMVPSIDAEHPHLTKPPMTYWALAASFGAFGANEWAARLPAALSFVGTGLLVFGLGRRLVPARPWLAPIVWSLSFAPFLSANIVSTDCLLLLFETGSMWAFVEAWSRPPEARRGWTRLMWLGWGLAFMTKGPPGLLPLLAMITFLALHDRRRLRGLFDPVGLLVFAVTAGAWFVLVILQDPGRLEYFLGYEVYDRVFTATHNRNAEWYGGLVVYLPVLLVGALPWSALAVAAAGGVRPAWSRVSQRVRERNPQWLLLLYWFLVPLAIFMLARSRLPLYIMPLFVPLSLMFARALAGWAWLGERRVRFIAIVTALVLLSCKAGLGYWHSDRDSRSMAAAVREVADPSRFDGITFLEMRPFYGLNVYLGKPVKAVPFVANTGNLSAYARGEDLCTELARSRRTLFAMKQNKVDRFKDGTAHCGTATPEEVGHFNADGNKIALYVVRGPAALPGS